MEFNFNAAEVLRTDDDGFAIIDAANPPPFLRAGGFGQNAFRSTHFQS